MTGPAYLGPDTILRERYEVLREIGRGGYSVVYLARDRQVDGQVAVKLLVPPPAGAQVARERMRREVQAVRGLSHANIVAVFDFLEEGPWSFIVMEYVAGPDLQVRVRERGPLNGEEAVPLGRGIAAALAAAHRRGILHRDVKPQNILLDPDGRARLTDFGSAKLDGQVGVTATGALAGTLIYSAPEVLGGRRSDARADIYALGLTLYYALTGELPERPSSQVPPAPAATGFHPRSVVDGIPEWLDQVIARATAAAPEDRFPTAAALDEALARRDAVASIPTPEAIARCVLCGGPDPLALGLCPACGGTSGTADTLIFLQRTRGAARHATVAQLDELLPAAASPEDRLAAARGERPLFRVPRVGSDRLMEQLEKRHLPGRAVPASRAWAVFPTGYLALVGSVIVMGELAGSVMPLLVWTTPVFGALLLVGAHRVARTPLVASPSRPADLPPELEERVFQTLARLSPGTARSLLADVVRSTRILFGQLGRTGDPHRIAPALSELLTAACASAGELADLDDNLTRFERQRDRFTSLPEGWVDALSRCERTRDALVQRLLEAMTVVGQLQIQSADEAAPALAELTRELQGEAERQTAAAEEITRFLERKPAAL
ncbi:MAG TPA: protein kinase [Gemmatimonadales bacterium]